MISLDRLKKHIEDLPNELLNQVIAIYLYGSAARGDTDNQSDVDLFFAIQDCSDDYYVSFKRNLTSYFNCNEVEVSIYQQKMIFEMFTKGSYFLWHLKQEGVQLYKSSTWMSNLLNTLPVYKGTFDDFREYRQVLGDIEESISLDLSTVNYELSTLAILIRNTCIGLCYINGVKSFSRRSPIIWCLETYSGKIPFTIEEFDVLYYYRIAQTRGHDIEGCTDLGYVYTWIKNTKALLDLAISIREAL